MPRLPRNEVAFRAYRNTRLYRSVSRVMREYNRVLVARLHEGGFTDFTPAYPALLSNLDTAGTRIGVLAQRAGVTRQAAGQLLREIERKGYVELRAARDDARATTVHFTARGRRMLATVVVIVNEMEAGFRELFDDGEYEWIAEGMMIIADAMDPRGVLTENDG